MIKKDTSQREMSLLDGIPLISQDDCPAGISTIRFTVVAGLHRASPSAALDKKIYNISFSCVDKDYTA
ncbi:hypothetical protein N007_21265 [Alicyclobacillus acidoterrestris ATCC 49025]|nr:hypothetical protein N007_21265 [Alicyclobacillus acidoterrestris ATCC 49025]